MEKPKDETDLDKLMLIVLMPSLPKTGIDVAINKIIEAHEASGYERARAE